MSQWRVLIPIGIALVLWAGFVYRDDVPAISLGPAANASQPCRPTAAEIAATEIATTAYPTTTMTPTPVTTPSVTTELAVLVGDQEIPLLLPSLVIRAPLADQPEINELLRTSLMHSESEVDPAESESASLSLDERVSSNPYRTLLIELLMSDPTDGDDIGVLSGSTEGNARAILRDVVGITDPPLLGVSENGTVTLVIPQSAKVLADKTEEIAGGWTVISSGREIRFLFDGQPSARTAWHVAVCTDGLPIISAGLATRTPTPANSPDPQQTPAAIVAEPPTPAAAASPPVPATPALAFQNSGRVSWSSPIDAVPTRVEVIAQASPLAALRMWLFTNAKHLVTTLALLVPALLLLAGAYVLSRASVKHLELSQPRTVLLDTTWAILRLTIAVIAFGIIVELFSSNQYASVLIDTRAVPAVRSAPRVQPSPEAAATPGTATPEDWITLPYRALYDETATRLQWPATVALAVLLLGFLDAPRPGGMTNRRWVIEALLAGISIALILFCLRYLSRESFATMFSVISPSLLIAGFTMFLAAAARTWRQAHSLPWPSYRLLFPALGAASIALCTWVRAVRVSDDPNAFVAGAFLPLWVTTCAVVGFVLLVAPIADIRSLIGLKAPRSNGIRPRVIPLRRVHWLIIGVVALVLAIIMQWEWANYSEENLWWRTAAEADPLDRLSEISRAHLEDPRGGERGDPSTFDPLGVDTNLTRYPAGFFVTSLDLFFILGLVGVLLALRAAGQPRDRESGWPAFWDADQLWIVWVLSGLFAAFVVGYGGEVLGLRAPVAFIISMIIFPWAVASRIPDDSARIDTENARLQGKRPLIATHRGELLRRAFALADLEKIRAAHFGNREARAPGSAEHLDARAYIASLGQLTSKAGAIQRGRGGPNRTLQLDEQDVPGELALALGPVEGWWRDGVRAAELGSRLAIVPIAYFAYIFLSSAGAGRWSLNTPFAVVGLISGLTYEIAFWLVAAFAFGCLFPYLRGQNGPVKGVVLAALYIAANAGAALLGIPGNALWQVRAFQLLLFLMLLGAWLDLQTVEAQGLRRRDLIALYDLPKTATLVSQVLPLVTALAAVILQLFLGQTQAATTSLVSGDASKAILEFIKASSR